MDEARDEDDVEHEQDSPADGDAHDDDQGNVGLARENLTDQEASTSVDPGTA